MRILVPAWSFEDSFCDNVVFTLRDMGHDVTTLGEARHSRNWSAGRRLLAASLQYAMPHRPPVWQRRVLRLARRLKPDLVLGTTTMLHPEVLAALGGLARGRCVLWWGDAPANSLGWGILDSGWDHVFLKDELAVSKLRIAGRNAHLLHEAMNPRWHRVISGQQNGDIVVAGNWYSYRQAIAVRLLEDDIPLQLYGPPPPRWSHPEIRRRHSGRYIVREEKSRIFGSGLACLNTFALAEGNSLNCRAFEISGAGGLQLAEWRPIITDCFDPGTEILTFQTYDELSEHIARAVRCPEEMQRIRDAGHKRANADHTYRHRLSEIFRIVA